jgi:hypothetical protein
LALGQQTELIAPLGEDVFEETAMAVNESLHAR